MKEEIPLPTESALAERGRREKKAFWWACGFLGATTLVWIGTGIGVYFAQRRLFELMAVPDVTVEDVRAFIARVQFWRYGAFGLLAILALGFFVNLARWIIAIRRRRAVETGKGR